MRSTFDVFAPTALGSVLNDATIPRLRCRVVCGGANNQLAEARHDAALAARGIVFVPDYLANAGGVIAADGMENQVIAEVVGADQNTVGKWRRRFAEQRIGGQRIGGLCDEPRGGAPRQIGDDEIAETVRLTLETTLPAATHWSLRAMAAAVGHAPSTVHRIWKAFGLQPHRCETFKLSSDPRFVEKVRDIVGLYLGPPDQARELERHASGPSVPELIAQEEQRSASYDGRTVFGWERDRAPARIGNIDGGR